MEFVGVIYLGIGLFYFPRHLHDNHFAHINAYFAVVHLTFFRVTRLNKGVFSVPNSTC